MRLAIIGAGHVGATAAYALMLRALVDEIVVIDSDMALARAEAADLSDANALARPANIWAGDYGDTAPAAIAVITAGAATHGAETRLSVAARSARIVEACVDGLVSAGFTGIILVAANPVDLMTLVAHRRSSFAPGRVIGTGTLLDSSRFRQAIGKRLDIAPTAIEALVLGEHGDSEVAAFSTARVGGILLSSFADAAGARLDKADIAAKVRTAGYDIIAGKGYTSFGIATAVVRICEAILRDEHAILPVSTMLTGQYGISDLYLSLPCVLGRAGVERVLTPDLNDEERAGLCASADVIRTASDALQMGAQR
ncbi:MAG: L-lactate dehydrogenase [Rhizorhabdus sp.]